MAAHRSFSRGRIDTGYTFTHAVGEQTTNGPVDAGQEHPSSSRYGEIPVVTW